LLNNAGKAKGLAPIQEGQLEHWEEMIDTNIKGLLYLTRAVAPLMAERGSGHIINISSTAGKEVYPNGNVYCATKYAVEALTKAMRIDLHKYNIRVSQVAPGHVEETEFALVRFDGDAEKAKIYEDFQPLTSKDVAEAIYFIASRPSHVNIQDVLMMGTQQASSTIIDKSGR
jgi:NADP-dependent 3-hydroxy acid dehydrogenase YdfG